MGTYLITDGDECKQSVRCAIEAGYRLIGVYSLDVFYFHSALYFMRLISDTATLYNNEQFIGEVLNDTEFLSSLKLERKGIFVTTKLHPADQGKGKCREAVLTSLAKLQLDCVDLVLIHWPGTRGIPVESPENAVLRKESWEDLEHLVRDKKIRSIGVSNYCISHLEQLLAHCTIRPSVNQVEFHPLLYQKELLDYCRAEGIVLQAYSSLGSAKGWETLSSSQVLLDIAKDKGKSVAQVLLRWAIAHGVPVIPKSTKENRIRDNIDLSFELSEEELTRIDNLNQGKHFCGDPSTVL